MIIKSPLNGKKPKIHETAFVAPTAALIGDVKIAEGANIWFSAVLRADWGTIRIGRNTSVQDNSTIHVEPSSVADIGENCIVGHNAMIHGPTKIGNNVLIGIGAVVLPRTVIEENTIIGAGAVVIERSRCKSLTLYGGKSVAEPIKTYRNEKVIARQLTMGSRMYVENGRKFQELFKE
ncbi:MAG: gamma carbonic anhydrase family protein [Candidatus Helarchaeota archaeon]